MKYIKAKHLFIGLLLGFLILFSSSVDQNTMSFNRESSSPHLSSPGKTPLWKCRFPRAPRYLAISSNGSYIAVAVPGVGDVYLFHNSSSTPLFNYSLNGYLNSIAISSDGRFFAVGGEELFFFNHSSRLWRFFKIGFVGRVSLSSTGSYLTAISEHVFFFNTSTTVPKKPEWVNMTGFDKSYDRYLDMSSNANYIVAGGMVPHLPDYAIFLFNTLSSVPVWIFYHHGLDMFIYGLDMSTDGNYIVSNYGFSMSLFSRVSSDPLWTYTGTRPIVDVAISGDGSYIAAVNLDGILYFFNKSSPTPMWSYNMKYESTLVSISSDGRYIVANGGVNRRKIYLFNSSTGLPLWSYTASENLYCLEISSNGKYIACGSANRYLYLFSSDVPLGEKPIISFGIYYIWYIVVGISVIVIYIIKKKEIIKSRY